MATKKNTPKKRKFAQELPVRLEDHELLERGKKLAQTNEKLQQFMGESKLIAQDRKKKLIILQDEHDKLNKAVSTGEEPRMVDCIEEADFDRNRIVVKRLDTDETISERAMEGDERETLAQGDLIPNGLDGESHEDEPPRAKA